MKLALNIDLLPTRLGTVHAAGAAWVAVVSCLCRNVIEAVVGHRHILTPLYCTCLQREQFSFHPGHCALDSIHSTGIGMWMSLDNRMVA